MRTTTIIQTEGTRCALVQSQRTSNLLLFSKIERAAVRLQVNEENEVN